MVSVRGLKRPLSETICDIHFIYFVFIYKFTVSLKSQQLLLWLPGGTSGLSLSLFCEADGDLFAFASVGFWYGSS